MITCFIIASTDAKWWGGSGGVRGGQGGNGGHGGGGGGGGGGGQGQGQSVDLVSEPGKLDGTPAADELIFMRQEEKMARDVYDEMYKLWGLRVFSNIAKAEEWHMEQMLQMLEKYGLEDPVPPSEYGPGEFEDDDVQEMYDAFIEEGEKSPNAALSVGARIEEVDIADLEDAIDKTDEATLDQVYGRLLRASENHLRAFARNLGGDYDAQLLSQGEVDSILLGD